MVDYIPKFNPGAAVTCTASGSVTGGRLVQVTDDRTVAITTALATAVVGVAGRDVVDGERVVVFGPGVHTLTAAGPISAGSAVYAGADGKAASTGAVVVGLALTTSAADADPIEVLLFGPLIGDGGASGTAWAAITDKPAVIAAGATATAARAAISAVDVAGAVAGVAAKTEVAALAAITTTDATDETTAIALVNELKASVNAIIAALQA